jgi:hypothetical protein
MQTWFHGLEPNSPKDCVARRRPTKNSVTAPREDSGRKLKPYTEENLNCRVSIMRWVRLILQSCGLSCMKSPTYCLQAQQENLLIFGSISNYARAPAERADGARAASGHAAAAPPRNVMKSRRFIRSPRRRSLATSAARSGRVLWRS